MKRKLSVIFVIILILQCVCGCTPHTPPEPYDPNALVIMGKRTDMEKPYMKKIFEKYKNDTGKNLRIVEINDAEYEDEAIRRFSSGEDVPDIFFHFHNDDLNRLNIENNFFYLENESWVDDLTQSALNYCTDSNGHLLGLPFWESSVSGCYYNKKLLSGLDSAYSQPNFDFMCRSIKNFYGVTPICWPANGCTWMYQFALDPIFADGPEGAEKLQKLNSDEISYKDIPEVRQMVEWVYNAAKQGWFGNDYLTCGWDDISANLNSGKAAMIFIWDTWFYTDFIEGKYKKEDFALMPVFMGTVDEGTYEGGNINMMMVNKNGPRLEEAKKFISFCATSENYNYAFEGVPTVSCFKGLTTNVQSHMVTDEKTAVSIQQKERVSTASTKIAGYNAEDVADAFNKLLRDEIDIDHCIELLDEYRIAKKSK